MKRFLLITTALLLSLSAWTQNLDYYRTLLPKDPNFEVIDAQNDVSGNTYLLIRFQGEHTIPIADQTISSPDGKHAFVVLCYEKYASCNREVTICAYSLSSSTSSVYDLKFVKTKRSLAVMGKKGSGTLDISGTMNYSNPASLSATTSNSSLFLAHFRNDAISGGCSHKRYHPKYLKTFAYTGLPFIKVLKSYSIADTDDYFVFAGSFTYNLTIGTTTLSAGSVRMPFVAKINIWGDQAESYSVNFAKRIRVYGSNSEKYGEITDLAINNSDIVVVGEGRGYLDMNTSSSSSALDLGSTKRVFIGRYSRLNSFSYKAKYRLASTSARDYGISIISDNSNNFFISYRSIYSVSGLNADFKYGSSSGSAVGNCFIAKYNPSLSLLWKMNNPSKISRTEDKIGTNNSGDLCLLTDFRGTKNFDPKGTTPIYYTAESWTEPNPVNYFLGRYKDSDGTLITGNTMRIRDPGSDLYKMFLGTNKSSSKLSIISYGNKVDYDLGIGEDIISYTNATYFVATYNECSKTTVGSNFSRIICEDGELNSTSVYASGTGTLHYRWFKNGQALQNGTFAEGIITQSDTKQLKISDITPEATGSYKLEVTSSCDIPRFSNAATFTVRPKTHITQEPIGKIVCEGASASFSVNADNNPSYKWQVNTGNGGFTDVSGGNSATLVINNATLDMAGYQYRCKVYKYCNTVYSETVNLGVNPNPSIQAQPLANIEICEGVQTTISVVTNGAGLDYQWQVSTNNGSSFSNISNGTSYSGTQNATLNINNPTLAYDNNKYRCIVSGDCGSSVISNQTNLSVKKSVQLISNPQSKNLCQYEDATFNVNVQGDNVVYVWQVNTGSGWVNLNNDNTYSNVNNPSLDVHSASTDMSGYQYRCKISSPCSTPIYSNTANLNVTPIPTVSLSSSEGSDICEGTNTTLSSNLGTGSYTYQWKRNFETVSAGTNSTLTANQSGAYTLYVEENVSGCTFESDPILLNVHSLPNNTTTLNGSNQLCEGESRQLMVPAGNGYTYQWYQNGNPMSGQTSHSLFVNASGTYHAKIISDYACENTSADEIITVNANPIVDLTTVDTEICEGEQTTINATSNSAYNYQWKRNGNVVTGETANALQVSQAGVYSVEVVNASTNCSAMSNSLTINLHSLPNNNITVVGGNAFCEGFSTELTVPAGNGYTYQWYQNNSPISGETANSITVNEAGTYKAKITSAYACENTSADEIITVNANPVVGLTTGDAELCEGEQTTINATSNSAYNYQWKRNGNVVTGETASALQVGQAGVYSVEVVNASTNCSAVSDPLTVSVHSLPNNNITVLGGNAFCEGLSTELTVPAGNGYTYQWYQNNNPVVGETANSITVNEAGTYKAKITSAYGCENTSANENITVHPNPTVDLTTDDAELCEGEQTTINATSNSAYTYQWKRNGNVVAGETASALQVSQAGVYSVEVVNASTNCSTVSDPLTVSVHALPNNNITIVGNNAFCEGLSAELTVPAGNGYTYQWYQNNNPVSGETANSLIVSEAGDYKAKIINAYGCENMSAVESITINPNPVVNLTTDDAEICEGEQTSIEATSNANYTYQWKRNGSALTGETSNTLQADQAGVYNVSVVNTVTNCSATSEGLSINVHSLPNNTITVLGNTTFCEGLSTQLSIQAGSNSTFQWYKDNTLINNQSSHSLFVSESGTYYAEITSAYGCESTSTSETITVQPNPTVSLTSQDAELCEGEQATINATTNTDYTYLWRRNGVVLSGETTDVLQTNQAGAYSVEVVNASTNCSAVSDPLSVSVHALPNNNITLIGSPVFCEGLSAGLTVPAGNGYAYEWYKDNTLISGQTSNSLTVTEAGAYHAQINDAYGCQNTSEDKVITVSPSPELSLTVIDSELCQGEETTISTEENGDYFYQWLHNNNEMPGETSHSVQVSEAGLYKVSVVNTVTGCSGISDYTVVTVNPLPNPELSVSGDLTVCVEDTVELYLDQTYSQYLWQDQSTNASLPIYSAGNYMVTVTDENNCQNSAEIEINEILVPTPDICMVTADTSLNKNLIVWETLTDVAGIASYNIYKMEANDYVLLGNILYGDTTEFVDMTSEPDIHADKYVIASVDQCGNVGAYSPYHQTMSLSINSSVTDDANLIWTRYIDESGVNNPTEYEIYRGVNEWSYHASVPGGFSGDTYVYTVDNIQEGERFIVVVQRPESCAPLNGVDGLKATGGPYYQSVSNLEDEGMIHTDIQGLETTLFRVYPNPAKDRITIQSDKPIERVRLLDVSSKVVLDQKGNAGNEFGLDLHIFAKGLYFIEVNGQKSKLVIE